MIKEPTITELSDGSALATFHGLTGEEIKTFAAIGMLTAIKEAVAEFTADLKAAQLLAAADKKLKKRQTKKTPVKKKPVAKKKGKCK